MLGIDVHFPHSEFAVAELFHPEEEIASGVPRLLEGDDRASRRRTGSLGEDGGEGVGVCVGVGVGRDIDVNQTAMEVESGDGWSGGAVVGFER